MSMQVYFAAPRTIPTEDAAERAATIVYRSVKSTRVRKRRPDEDATRGVWRIARHDPTNNLHLYENDALRFTIRIDSNDRDAVDSCCR